MQNVALQKSKTPNRPRICDVLDSIVEIANEIGIKAKGHSEISVSIFGKLPPAVQKQLEIDLNSYRILMHKVIEFRGKEDREKLMFKEAIQTLNFMVTDDFTNKITNEDIVEIYFTDSMVQVYRNLEFMRVCSYDILMMTAVPFPELFQRDLTVTNKIIDRTSWVAKNAEGLCGWEVEDNLLRESYIPNGRTYRMVHKNLAPVFNKVTGQRVAWASTLLAQPLDQGIA